MGITCRPTHPTGAQWLQLLQIRGATRRTARFCCTTGENGCTHTSAVSFWRCGCRIYCQMRGCRCCKAVCLLPPVPSAILIRLALWLPSHAHMHECSASYMSVYFWLTALSPSRLSGFPLLLLWAPLCSCRLNWPPLAACSLPVFLLPVGKCRWEDNTKSRRLGSHAAVCDKRASVT